MSTGYSIESSNGVIMRDFPVNGLLRWSTQVALQAMWRYQTCVDIFEMMKKLYPQHEKDINLPRHLELATNFRSVNTAVTSYRARTISYVINCIKPVKSFSVFKYGNKVAFEKAVEVYAQVKGLTETQTRNLLRKRPPLKRIREIAILRNERSGAGMDEEDLAYIDEHLHS